jgi:multidrug efflux pump subunit AcrB
MVRRFSVVVLAIYGGLLGFTSLEFTTVPLGCIPAPDKGSMLVDVQLPYGASLERTDAVVRRASDTILDVPGITHAVGFAGFSGATLSNPSHAGPIFATLEPFEERAAHGPSTTAIMQHLCQRLASAREARISVLPLQLYTDVDCIKAKKLNVPPNNLLTSHRCVSGPRTSTTSTCSAALSG